MMANSKIIFDTDCLSSFLWVDELNILYSLFQDSIKIPLAVYKEIERMKKSKKYSYVFSRLESSIKNQKIEILEIQSESDIENMLESIRNDYKNETGKEIGAGEAEMLALAKYYNAICIVKSASNNLSDVHKIATKEKIANITTMDILCEAFTEKLKSLEELENIKKQMENKKRHLPKISVEDELKKRNIIK